MILGAIEALKNAGRLKGKYLSGIDGTDEAKILVKEGGLTQTVLQDAKGQAEACAIALEKIMNGEDVDKEIIVPYRSITAENINEFM